jgi:hypothetical protein
VKFLLSKINSSFPYLFSIMANSRFLVHDFCFVCRRSFVLVHGGQLVQVHKTCTRFLPFDVQYLYHPSHAFRRPFHLCITSTCTGIFLLGSPLIPSLHFRFPKNVHFSLDRLGAFDYYTHYRYAGHTLCAAFFFID